jgi:hypothetical protein
MIDPTPDTPLDRDHKAEALATDLRRFKWFTYALYAVACGLAILAALLYGRVDNAVDQIQTERARNTLSSCQTANRQSAAIRSFVRGTIPKARMETPSVRLYVRLSKQGKPIPADLVARSEIVMFLNRAATTFPDRDCERELAQKVKGAEP